MVARNLACHEKKSRKREEEKTRKLIHERTRAAQLININTWIEINTKANVYACSTKSKSNIAIHV